MVKSEFEERMAIKTPLEMAWERAGDDAKAKRKVVMAFMHWDGEYRHLLPADEWVELYLLADGFGSIGLATARIALEFDWSHVRDSSPEAVELMFDHIVRHISSRDAFESVLLSAAAKGAL